MIDITRGQRLRWLLWLYWIRWPGVIRTPVDYVVAFFARGARPVKIGKKDAFREAQGEIVEDGISVRFGGACPVQGEGTVDGRLVYYRSRGTGWQFHVADEGAQNGQDEHGETLAALYEEVWFFEEYKYFGYDGGWVHADVSRECIRRAVTKWRAEGRP